MASLVDPSAYLLEGLNGQKAEPQKATLRYRPLRPDAIRLLKFQTGSTPDNIRLTMDYYVKCSRRDNEAEPAASSNLASERIKYAALSYCWGDPYLQH